MTNEARKREGHGDGRVWLEWFAGAIGLLLAAALIATIGYQAVAGDNASPPDLEFKVSSAQPSGNFYIVKLEAQNRSEATAQQVEVEVALTRAGREVEKAKVTFDYVPGGSTVKGGVFFTEDPQRGELAVRPLGYTRP